MIEQRDGDIFLRQFSQRRISGTPYPWAIGVESRSTSPGSLNLSGNFVATCTRPLNQRGENLRVLSKTGIIREVEKKNSKLLWPACRHVR